MKKLFPVICLLSCLIAGHSFAGSATWNLDPTSGDWNTAANWTPATVPNSAADTATFELSNLTNVSLSAAVQVDGVVFNRDANAFTINISPGVVLTISGAGVTNDSGVVQNFINQEKEEGAGQLYFTNSATAGDSLVVYTNHTPFMGGGIPLIQFEGNSTAGSAKFINKAGGGFSRSGTIEFQGNSTAGSATFRSAGYASQQETPVNFRDQASAGQAVFTNDMYASGTVNFYDSATADHATITTLGAFSGAFFHDDSTAGSATIINEGGTYYLGAGITYFYDNSTAGNGTFIADGALTDYFGYATVELWSNAMAGTGTFIANGGQVPDAGGGIIYINNTASAENGTFIANGGMVTGASGGRIVFGLFDSTAASATLIANDGGDMDGGGIDFRDNSTGDQARVAVFGNGFLDAQLRDTPELTIGSLEGDGLVLLGTTNLSVGSNNLNTTFSGLIQGDGGALTKIGNGTLTLTGANTYTGGTTIEGGNLILNNKAGSATGTGMVKMNAGRLAGRGTVGGAVVVGDASGQRAALAPGRPGGKPDSLTIQSTLTFNYDGSYECGLNSQSAVADKVVASGVTINSGQFSLRDRRRSSLAVGTILMVIDNTSADPISGAFANLGDGSTITVGSNTYQADYEGGDGNDLTLTVVP